MSKAIVFDSYITRLKPESQFPLIITLTVDRDNFINHQCENRDELMDLCQRLIGRKIQIFFNAKNITGKFDEFARCLIVKFGKD